MSEIKGKNAFDSGASSRMSEIKGKNAFDFGPRGRKANLLQPSTLIFLWINISNE
ncbi:hypothetical protein [Paenibacillus sp. DMB5]|uniref:hypothetical protein n=1 Tax=Paenibacillus sp. DMB5 TaxID=1780103 RepID=UPI000A786577|nr:hypothetical protein [Paenibacillus sp. DMB5]